MSKVAVIIPIYKLPEKLNQFERDSISNCINKFIVGLNLSVLIQNILNQFQVTIIC